MCVCGMLLVILYPRGWQGHQDGVCVWEPTPGHASASQDTASRTMRRAVDVCEATNQCRVRSGCRVDASGPGCAFLCPLPAADLCQASSLSASRSRGAAGCSRCAPCQRQNQPGVPGRAVARDAGPLGRVPCCPSGIQPGCGQKAFLSWHQKTKQGCMAQKGNYKMEMHKSLQRTAQHTGLPMDHGMGHEGAW